MTNRGAELGTALSPVAALTPDRYISGGYMSNRRVSNGRGVGWLGALRGYVA